MGSMATQNRTYDGCLMPGVTRASDGHRLLGLWRLGERTFCVFGMYLPWGYGEWVCGVLEVHIEKVQCSRSHW